MVKPMHFSPLSKLYHSSVMYYVDSLAKWWKRLCLPIVKLYYIHGNYRAFAKSVFVQVSRINLDCAQIVLPLNIVAIGKLAQGWLLSNHKVSMNVSSTCVENFLLPISMRYLKQFILAVSRSYWWSGVDAILK